MKVLKWVAFSALGIVGLVCIALFGGWSWEQWTEARDAKRYPPPGRMVDVGNGLRHILCEGSGAPTVVLITGGGIPLILIRPLQDRVARFARVCAYDRAGFGWSEPAIRALNIAGHAAELRSILAGAGETGPFILVGHSYGGLIARQYVRDNSEAVVGVVLVDAAEEGLVYQSNFLQTVPAGIAQYRQSEKMARVGLLRALVVINPALARYSSVLTEAERRQANALLLRPSYFRAAADEATNAYENTPATMQQPGGFGTLGSLPLVVIRHGRPFTGPEASLETGWTAAQTRLAALSSDSRMIVAKDDGHLVMDDNPDLVASAISEVADAVRAHRALN